MAKFHNDLPFQYFSDTLSVFTFPRLMSHAGVVYMNYMDYIPLPYVWHIRREKIEIFDVIELLEMLIAMKLDDFMLDISSKRVYCNIYDILHFTIKWSRSDLQKMNKSLKKIPGS